jgi:hypothetical protein
MHVACGHRSRDLPGAAPRRRLRGRRGGAPSPGGGRSAVNDRYARFRRPAFALARRILADDALADDALADDAILEVFRSDWRRAPSSAR